MLGIVIVNHNRIELNWECIASILAGSFREFRIFFVENGSNPRVKDAVKEWCRNQPVHLIDLPENTGFCRGTNIGTRAALDSGCDHVLWLNNDTQVQTNCVQALLARARLVGNGCVVTGKISYAHDPHLIWYAGGHINRLAGVGKHAGFRQLDQGQWDQARIVEYVTGCLALVPRAVFERVGFLNEDLFTYMDDTEFSLRLSKHKVPIWYEPKAKILHKIGSGVSLQEYSPLYLYLTTRNRPYVTQNWLYRFYLRLIALAVTSLKIIILLKPGIRGRGRKIEALWAGFLDSFRLSRAPWKGPAWIYQSGK